MPQSGTQAQYVHYAVYSIWKGSVPIIPPCTSQENVNSPAEIGASDSNSRNTSSTISSTSSSNIGFSNSSDVSVGIPSVSDGGQSSSQPLTDGRLTDLAAQIFEEAQGQAADRISGQDAIDRYLTLYPDG